MTTMVQKEVSPFKRFFRIPENPLRAGLSKRWGKTSEFFKLAQNGGIYT